MKRFRGIVFVFLFLMVIVRIFANRENITQGKLNQANVKPEFATAIADGIEDSDEDYEEKILSISKFKKSKYKLKIGNDFELLDTPGILWPKFESEEVGNKLALTGAIKDALLHMDDIALFALSQFKLDYPEYLKKAYRSIDSDLELSNVDLLMLITKNLGFKEDYEKASERIVFDIRSGKLGRYTLDQAPVSLMGEE